MAAPKGNNYYLLGLSTTGRDPKYKTAKALQEKVVEYFTLCIKEKKYPKISGIALHLGFKSRASLDDYCNLREDFSYIIKRAKLVVENGYEDMLQNGTTAAIFALKNMGWTDSQQIDHTTAGQSLNDAAAGLSFEEAYKLKYGKAPDSAAD